jgi:hypothetical protein
MAAASGSCDSFIYQKSKKMCSLFTGAWKPGFGSDAPCLTWTKNIDFSTGALYAGDEPPDFDLSDRTCA